MKRAKQRAADYGYKAPHFTRAEWLALVEACGGRCLRCAAVEDLTVDHVVPLAPEGSNAIDNVQPLCSACNNLKGCVIVDYRQGSEVA